MVVDTNVISEPVRLRPNEMVVRWLNSLALTELYFTVTSLTELKVGVNTMPAGKRREALRTALDRAVARYFGPRILTVGEDIADYHAEIVERAKSKGIAIAFADAQIAAIAKSKGFSVATRDVAPFEAAGVEVINPWDWKGA